MKILLQPYFSKKQNKQGKKEYSVYRKARVVAKEVKEKIMYKDQFHLRMNTSTLLELFGNLLTFNSLGKL